ncbi:hypothetical protein BZA77DRAFT_305291 [Pyronema omphalodes]|nr:hypothetical protein BZA77DRAFT_305291 [Pyronema omphalodes]
MFSYIKKLKPGKTSQSETTKAQTSQDEKTPVLSTADEQFLEEAMKEADDKPNVIFPGKASKAVEEAAEEAKNSEWKDVIVDRWRGLRKTVEDVSKESQKHSQEKKEKKEKAKSEKEIKKEKEKEKKDKGKQKEIVREEDELTAVLDQLNLTAEDGRVFSLSAETRVLLTRFTQILRDIGNGVPTAYDDLTNLLTNSNEQLSKTYSELPSFLQKLIKALPDKLKPEIIKTAAAAAPALATETVGLKELISNPGALMGLLKGVVNVLKTRFPALLGANAAISMGLFVVLLVLWYCHKRGREVRLEAEAREKEMKDTEGAAERDAESAAQKSATEGDLQGGSRA